MRQTEKLNLKLIEGTDPVDWEVLNGNAEKLEAKFGTVANALAEQAANLGTAGKNARMVWGTYTGTGTYGESKPTRISPGFCPVLVMVGPAGTAGCYGWPTTMLRDCEYANGASIHSYLLPVRWTDTEVFWFSTQDADQQMNVSGTVYYYVALGYDA